MVVVMAIFYFMRLWAPGKKDGVSLLVSNIQRMCFEDGPGIRTTVFLQGCSLHCPWCANPEMIPKKAYPEYPARVYEAAELAEELQKDRIFWGEEGGITISGGEALLQAEGLAEILPVLKAEKIHVAVETALFVPRINLEMLCSWIDLWIVDLKILNPDLCCSILGGDPAFYRENVRFLHDRGAEVMFRIPCSKEYVLREPNRGTLTEFLTEYVCYPSALFSLHGLADEKYRRLGRNMESFEPAGSEELESFQNILRSRGCRVKIIDL